MIQLKYWACKEVESQEWGEQWEQSADVAGPTLDLW